MDWNTLISVAIGGLIATMGSILNNRFQSREHAKDRQEQRRDAKIQAREKWIERDILEIMESINVVLSELSLRYTLVSKVNISPELKNIKLSPDDIWPVELKEHMNEAFLSSRKMYQAIVHIHTLTNSFGGEFQPEYRLFFNGYNEYIRSIRTELGEKGEEKRRGMWIKLCENAGNYHKVLREKLISVRE